MLCYRYILFENPPKSSRFVLFGNSRLHLPKKCCVMLRQHTLKPNTKIRLKHSWVIYIIVTSCGATPKLNWLTETPLACFSEIKVHLQNSSCPKTVFQVIHSDFPFSKTSQKRSQRIAKISFPPCFCSVNINVFSW